MRRFSTVSVFVFLSLFIVLFATACSASTANISSAQLAKGFKDNKAVDPISTFAPTDTFHLVVEVANAPDDTKVRAVWTAVDANNGQIKDQKIDEKELLTKDIGTVADFSLVPNNPFPVGKYKVDLYLNDKLDRTLTFDVQ